MDHNHDRMNSAINDTLEAITKSKLNDHANHNLKDGMSMSFHGGFSETILFEFWNTNNLPSNFLQNL